MTKIISKRVMPYHIWESIWGASSTVKSLLTDSRVYIWVQHLNCTKITKLRRALWLDLKPLTLYDVTETSCAFWFCTHSRVLIKMQRLENGWVGVWMVNGVKLVSASKPHSPGLKMCVDNWCWDWGLLVSLLACSTPVQILLGAGQVGLVMDGWIDEYFCFVLFF